MTSPRAEIDEDLRQERFEWRAQRAGWVLLLLFVLAAGAGLTGPGPLSQAEVAAGDLRLRHDRFVHREGPTELELEVAAGDGGEMELELGGDWLQAHRLEEVMPVPDRMLGGADRLTLVFARRRGETLRVRLFVLPERAGRFEGRLAAGGGPPLAFDVTVLP